MVQAIHNSYYSFNFKPHLLLCLWNILGAWFIYCKAIMTHQDFCLRQARGIPLPQLDQNVCLGYFIFLKCWAQAVPTGTWISVITVCAQHFSRLCLKALQIHNIQFILTGKRTARETYIFITFLLLQVAVCETSSALSIRNKLAIYLTIFHLCEIIWIVADVIIFGDSHILQFSQF